MKTMRIYMIVTGFFLLFCCGCSRMNDAHQEYLDRGETIYAARPDSIIAYAGNMRQQINIYYTAQRIQRCVLYWNLGADSMSFDLPLGSKYSVIIPGIPEGDYTYELITFDKYGNKGLPLEFVGKVYGENYRNALVNAGIQSMVRQGSNVLITWKPAESLLKVKLSYLNISGETVTLETSASEATTLLVSPQLGSDFTYSSFFLPERNALDIFETSAKGGILPK